MKCPQCRNELPAGAAFCPACGAAVGDASAAASSTPERLAAAVAAGARSNDAEQVLWEGRFSKLAMIGSWFGAGVGTLAALVAGWLLAFDARAWWITLGVLAVVWLALVARLVYQQLSIKYTLTTQRLIHEYGILWRSVDRIETIDIDDVALRQGPVERMFGVGTVSVQSSDRSTPNFPLVGIEDARKVASLIDEARRKERRKRGLHIETV